MVKTIAALVVVTIVLIIPSEITRYTPLEFLRLPLEAILGAGLLLSVREKARRPVAVILGVLLGTLAVIKLADLGFSFFLDRPFDPVGDWPFLAAAVEFLRESYGKAGAVIALALAVVLAVGLMALMTFAVSRLAEPLNRHRDVAARAVAITAVVWFALAALGLPNASHPWRCATPRRSR